MKYSKFETNINPEDSNYVLAGFKNRSNERRSYGKQDLKLKLLWLKENESNLIIISIDTLYLPSDLTNNITLYFHENYGVLKDSILFNATHTHSAPNISLKKFGSINSSYVETLKNKIIEGVRHCHNTFEECNIRFTAKKLGNEKIISRRKKGRDIRSLFFRKKILMLPNFNKEIDDSMRIMIVSDNLDRIKAIVYNFSCHPVFSSGNHLSADFPGAISDNLNKNTEMFSLYLQGFCGDIRPNYTTNKTSIVDIKSYLKILFNGSVFKRYTISDFNDFCNYFTKIIGEIKMSDAEIIKNIKIKSSSFETNLESVTKRTNININVKLTLFNSYIFISIPAEVNSSYYVNICRKFSNYNFIPMGYGEGMIGYLPFYSEIEEGGYEVWSASNYGWDSPLSPDSVKSFYKILLNNIQMLIESKEQ